MFPSKAARSASSIRHCRPFSSSASVAAVSPYRASPASPKSLQPTRSAPVTEKNGSKRSHGTVGVAQKAAAAQRPVPSPAFNRDDRWSKLASLRPTRQSEMDHSFVGMKGGEIFHEMMLRHGVKHICKFLQFPQLLQKKRKKKLFLYVETQAHTAFHTPLLSCTPAKTAAAYSCNPSASQHHFINTNF